MREWLKNISLFYILILMIISIPLLTVLAVLSIKTLVELRYWIAGSIGVLFFIAIFLLYKRRRRYKEEFNKNKEEMLKLLEHAINSGHDVDISFMGGLLKISYRQNKKIPPPKKEIPSIPQQITH